MDVRSNCTQHAFPRAGGPARAPGPGHDRDPFYPGTCGADLLSESAYVWLAYVMKGVDLRPLSTATGSHLGRGCPCSWHSPPL
jgi:hypothetical protein